MPLLVDMISKMTVNKTPVKPQNVQRQLFNIARDLNPEKLRLKNQMKTTLQVGSENAPLRIPGGEIEEYGVYASWNKYKDKLAKLDMAQLKPLNKVKEKEDYAKAAEEIQLALKLAQWKEEVADRMRKLGFKA